MPIPFPLARASTDSFAIESNLHSIPNLSPVVLYMQDDFFLLKKHTTADFVSPLYGPVLRLSSPKSYEIPSFRYPATGCEHEWSSLIRSAWLLGERFAKKKRGCTLPPFPLAPSLFPLHPPPSAPGGFR